jgi:DNA-binding MarR family transcriptional regulator
MAKRQELEKMAEEIDAHLRVVREILRRPMETEFARGNLTGPQRSVMQALVAADGMSLKDLSKQVGLAHSTVSGIVDRLEKRGMVGRQADEQDGRFSRIVASKAVRDFLRDALPGLAMHPIVNVLSRATKSERTSILEGLRTLRRIAEQGGRP